MPMHVSPGMLMGALSVTVSEEVPGHDALARGVLRGVSAGLQKAVAEVGGIDRKQLDERLQRAQQEYAEAERRLAEVQQRQQALGEATGTIAPSRELLVERARALAGERQDLELTIAAREATQEAIAEQIRRAGEGVQTALADDAAARELATVVKVREEELKRMNELFARGAAPQADVAHVEEQLALARADLARQQQRAAERAGGGRLGELNHELAAGALEVAGARARSALVKRELEQLTSPERLAQVDEYDRQVTMQLPLARAAVQEAAGFVQEVQRRLREYRAPAVVIIGGLPE